MAVNKNIIRSQTLHFRYNGNADGLAVQNDVANWCNVFLNPAIENILKEYEQTNEIIQLEELKIAAEVQGTTNWQIELSEKLARQLKEELQLRIQEKQNAVKVEVKNKAVEIKSAATSFFEKLIYFLKYGILPWSSVLQTKAAFDEALDKWIENITVAEAIKIGTILKDSNTILRLNNLLGEKQFETVVKKIVNDKAINIHELLKDAKLIATVVSKNDSERSLILFFLKEQLLSCLTDRPQPQLVYDVFKQWLYKIIPGSTLISKINPDEINSSFLQKELDDMQRDKNGKEKIIQAYTMNKKEEGPDKNSREEISREIAEGIFISNAGVVIIAPFLPRLFSNTGLLAEGNITDIPAALTLIHYCINGDTNAAEFELVLPKILCGVNLQAIVAATDLDDIIMKEADEMLSSAISHWGILKNTSIEGLRESFLKRNGKLSLKNDEWVLQVEQQSYDMLLQQLPWNISVIKLSWMQHLLKTEWIF